MNKLVDNKKFIFIIFALILIILGLLGYIVYEKSLPGNNARDQKITY